MDKHESIKRQLASLALGELSEREQAKVRAHVDRCGTCRAELTQIERLLDRAGKRKSLSADESLHESARIRLLAAIGSENQVETTARWHIRWALLGRRIVENRMTKLAAAIIVVAAIVLGVRSLDGTPVKAVEFSEIAKAMEEVPWMHASSSGFERGLTGVADQWIGFQSKIQAGRWADGKASFWNLREHRRAEYDPSSNTITLTYIKDNEYPLNLASPAMLLESMHKMLKDQGAEIVARMGEFQGRRVQVQEISLRNVGPNKESHTVTFYVDPRNNRLYAAQVSGVDAEGHVVIAGGITFDYPETGPQDIYDLGVPRNAQIVDQTPPDEFQAVWERYRRIRAEATKEYLAIITHAEHGDMISMVDVDYRSGRKYRLERHSVFHRGDVLKERWPQYRDQLGDTFESLFRWTREHYDDPRGHLSIDLYDGEYYCSTGRYEQDGWEKSRRRYEPDGSSGPLSSLGHLAWPDIVSTARIIDDDYAREKGLICIESLSQGRVIPDGHPSLPGRFLYYLDPAWDYLCRRQVTEWRPDADWQEDKNWLAGVDPNKARDGSITVQEITEASEAPNGRWYPVVIVEQSTRDRRDYREAPLTTGTTKRIYLDLAPEFPEGIFDTNKLPSQ
jgi:hypothetical protein